MDYSQILASQKIGTVARFRNEDEYYETMGQNVVTQAHLAYRTLKERMKRSQQRIPAFISSLLRRNKAPANVH